LFSLFFTEFIPNKVHSQVYYVLIIFHYYELQFMFLGLEHKRLVNSFSVTLSGTTA